MRYCCFSCVVVSFSLFPFFLDVVPFTVIASYQDTNKKRGNKVTRMLVTAAIPVFMSGSISVNEARDGIIAGLQESIQSGRFLSLAQSGGTFY